MWWRKISCWNRFGRSELSLKVRLKENERWLTMFENLKGFLLYEFLQIAHWMRQWCQLIVIEPKPMKERDENWNQISNWMSYAVKFVSWPIESGSELSWLLLRQILSREQWELKPNDKSNAVHSQVGQTSNRVWNGRQQVEAEIKTMIESNENSNQMTNWMSYTVRLVSCAIQSGSDVSWLWLRWRLTKRAMRIVIKRQI